MKKMILIAALLIPTPLYGVELPSFVTAKARAVCEPDVKRLCRITNAATYNIIKRCIKNNWDNLSNDCQYEIVSLVPQIEVYEKRQKNK